MARNSRHILGVVGLLLGAGVLVAGTVHVSNMAMLTTDSIQTALRHLADGQYDQAERKGLALATDSATPAPRAWAIVAAARQRRGECASAARAYRFFLATCECPATQQFALAQIAACDKPKSPRTSPLPPSRQLADDTARKLADVHDRLYTESTEHFVVQARNPAVAQLVAAQAEVALDRICRVILAGQAYPHTVQVNVWADHDQYLSHATDAPEWAGGSFRLTTVGGTLQRQIDLTQRDKLGRFAPIMLDRVLPHEMCHLVVKEYFGDTACPLFLDEGLAMLAEFEADHNRTRLAGNAIAGKAKTTLEGLLVRRRYSVREPAVFYAESYSFVEFLHDRVTPEQFRAMLQHVKAGCTVTDAIQRSLFLPAESSFLGELASAWEDHAVEQSQYLRALATQTD